MFCGLQYQFPVLNIIRAVIFIKAFKEFIFSFLISMDQKQGRMYIYIHLLFMHVFVKILMNLLINL